MALRLVDDDLDLSFDIPLSADARRGLIVQLQRSFGGEQKLAFENKLCHQLTRLLDEDLLLPSRKQVIYALSIAKTLDIPVPSEALQFRGAMHHFLARHAPLFRERLNVGSSEAPPSGAGDGEA
jgi:hypothetical protein